VLRQSHSIASQSIEVGRANFLLSETAQFTISQVIRQDENDIQPISRRTGNFTV